MFPIIFYSIGTLTFNNKYGMSPYVDNNIFNTCVAFSYIYIFYFFILSLSMFFKKNTDNYTKYQFIGNYIGDLLNSIIIIQCIGSKTIMTLILITIAKCIGSSYFRYEKKKLLFIVMHEFMVGIIESIILILLGLVINNYGGIIGLFVIVIVA